MDIDISVRLAAFSWLKDQVRIFGDVLPRAILEKGFEFEDARIPLVSPQGIFKPKKLDLVLSITTTPKSPYKDRYSETGYLIYSYRGTNPSHRDNVALRRTFNNNRPIIYFYGIDPGKYMAVWGCILLKMIQRIFFSKLLLMISKALI